MPRRIVVVCYGNICRSPFLEAALARSLPDISIQSAGLMGPTRPVPDDGIEAARTCGLDLTPHRSRLLNATILKDVHLVIAMDAAQARHVSVVYGYPSSRIVLAGDLDPLIADGRTIRDPWKQSRDVFAETYARLMRCAEVVRETLKR